MSPLVLSNAYVFNNRKICATLMGSKSRARKKSPAKSKSKSKSTAVGLLNAYLSTKSKIMVLGQERSAPDDGVTAAEEAGANRGGGDEEISRWTSGVYANGQFFLVSMGTMLSSGSYLPIIDKNGSLLGDFRKLDDLSLGDWEAS